MPEPKTDETPGTAPEETLLSLDEAVAHAVWLHQRGQVRQAAAIYTRVLEQQKDHVDALHFLGVALTQLRDFGSAEKLLRAVLYVDPKHADAHANLGNALKMQGKLEDARVAYEYALSLAPDHPNALNNLGTLFSAAERYPEAVAIYEKVLAQHPDHAEAHHNLGNVYMELGNEDAALDAFRRALSLKSYNAASYRSLGRTYAILNRMEDAAEMYARWAELAPEDPEAQHMYAAVAGARTPTRGSDGFVKQLFDRFANSFDQVLQGLNYQAPAIVGQVLAEVIGEGRRDLTILDAGCGTGLGGLVLKPFARRLVGVDLSDGMIAVARERQVYDEFVVSELARYMNAHPGAYDVVTAIDTFCYIGDLKETVEALARTLAKGGHAIFTVERSDAADAPEGYLLHPHGRYSHSPEYIREACTAGGLRVIRCQDEVLRKERSKPVAGLAVVLQR